MDNGCLSNKSIAQPISCSRWNRRDIIVLDDFEQTIQMVFYSFQIPNTPAILLILSQKKGGERG